MKVIKLEGGIFSLKPKNLESGSPVAGRMVSEHSTSLISAADPNSKLSAGPVNQSRTLQSEKVEVF